MISSSHPHPETSYCAKSSASTNVKRRLRSLSSVVVPKTSIPTPTTWVDYFEQNLRPYLHLSRIKKPAGALLLFYPCAWSITMASYSLRLPITAQFTCLSLFFVGALFMRGAGCTVNDMWDRNIDKVVERTKDRPLARGDVTITQAFWFLGLQFAVGIGLLMLSNWYSVRLGSLCLPLVVIYPLMKRITYCPSFVLGVAFNWGALVGWSAVAGAVDWSVCLPLYAGGICWSIISDTIYAHQDKKDDVNAGVRSAALLFGDRTLLALSGLSLSSMSFITLAGYMSGAGIPFYAGVGIAAIQLARVLKNTNFDDRASCWKGFVGSAWPGFWIWMGALANCLVPMV